MGRLGFRKLKTFMGREGHGFNVELTVDGKKVASVSNSGNGGCHLWYWDTEADKTEAKRLMREHPAYAKYLKEFPTLGEGEAPDHVVDALIDDVESEKQLRRWCKTKIVFRVADWPDGQYHTYKGMFNAANVAAIMQRYPGAEIINARFGQPTE